MNNHDLSVVPASHGRPDRGCSASVIGTKASEPKQMEVRFPPGVAYGSGGSGGVGSKSCSHPSWGHFANNEDDTRWFSDFYIPSWAIFVIGLAIGVTLSWLVL